MRESEFRYLAVDTPLPLTTTTIYTSSSSNNPGSCLIAILFAPWGGGGRCRYAFGARLGNNTLTSGVFFFFTRERDEGLIDSAVPSVWPIMCFEKVCLYVSASGALNDWGLTITPPLYRHSSIHSLSPSILRDVFFLHLLLLPPPSSPSSLSLRSDSRVSRLPVHGCLHCEP